MKDFFISYNKADQAWAVWIAWVLEAKGFTTHSQAWDFVPGSNWVLEMQKGAVETQHTIAVLSPEFLTAEFTQPEWAAAFARDPKGEKRTLIPVMVQDCKPECLLAAIVYINIVGLTEAAAQERLLASVTERRLKPTIKPAFPGSASRPVFPPELHSNQIWNVPLPRNPNFTGRIKLLEELRRSLESGVQVALTALHGLGGVGKTQVALEYAYRHRQDYQVVWWVRSEEPAQLASDYAALAGELDPAYKNVTDQRILKEFVRKWLEANTDWLMVLDNVVKPEDLTDFRPACCSGHLLITSRHEDWRAYGQPLSVPIFDHLSESVVFLMKRTGLTDEQAAAELAQELGDLPLALEHAAAYCTACGCSLNDYLNLFEKRRKELLDEAQKPQGYDYTVLTTWNVSFTEAAKTDGAADLLNLCAFFAPDDIPLNIIKEGVEFFPEALAKIVQDDLALNKALAALKRFSLITRTKDALSLHRLVQTVLRDRMMEEEQKLWAAAAVEIVYSSFPERCKDVNNWPICARLLSHAVATIERAENKDVKLEVAGPLRNNIGVYLQSLADYDHAKANLIKALQICERLFGIDHQNISPYINNLGSVLKDLGDLQGAKQHYERALQIDEKTLGPDHTDVAIVRNNLGLVYKDLKDFKKSKELFLRALQILKKNHLHDHSKGASTINNLGSVFHASGEFISAKKCFERAQSLDEKFFGDHHLYVARDLHNLGMVNKALGDLRKAKEYLERALSIKRINLPENHPDVKLTLRSLAALE